MITGLVLLTALFVAADEKKLEGDEAKVQGSWSIVSAANDGKKMPEETAKKQEIVLRDRTFTLLLDSKPKAKLTLTLDSTKKLKEIDLQREGFKDAALGIYKLDGDELTICYSEPGAKRPTEFSSEPGSKQFLLILKRKK